MTSFSGCDRYILVEIFDLKSNSVLDYWNTIIDSGLIRSRFPEMENPTIKNVEQMIKNPNSKVFLSFDPVLERFCGEVTLDGFQGLTACVHLSIHPEYFGRKAVDIGKDGAQQLFRLQNKEGINLKALLGLTPENNKLALRFIKRVGFKIMTILSGSFIMPDESRTQINGVVSQLTRSGLYGNPDNW